MRNIDRLARHMEERPAPWWRTRTGFVLVCFPGIAAFCPLTEHTAHVFGVLPYLFLLAFPGWLPRFESSMPSGPRPEDHR
jgi:hypothetical protein